MSFLLHIDTSTDHASVALSESNALLGCKTCNNQKDHASFLQPAIQELISESGKTIRMLSAVSVTIGPGSYTGLRVGLASAKGICYGLQIPLITISTTEMMASAAKTVLASRSTDLQRTVFCPMIDARRMEVFTAVYDANLNCLLDPRALVLDASAASMFPDDRPVLFFGSGAEKWKTICSLTHALFEEIQFDASSLIPLAAQKYEHAQFASVEQSVPFYGKEFYTPAKN